MNNIEEVELARVGGEGTVGKSPSQSSEKPVLQAEPPPGRRSSAQGGLHCKPNVSTEISVMHDSGRAQSQTTSLGQLFSLSPYLAACKISV